MQYNEIAPGLNQGQFLFSTIVNNPGGNKVNRSEGKKLSTPSPICIFDLPGER
jgi:hypothetical protein